jgi:hypothetical protein
MSTGIMEDEIYVMGNATTGVPPGTYFAMFTGREPCTTSKGDTVKWIWTITSDGPHKGMKASCFIDKMNPTPNNKLGRVLNGLAGRTLAEGERFNPNSVVGQLYVITVTLGKDGKGSRVETVASMPK